MKIATVAIVVSIAAVASVAVAGCGAATQNAAVSHSNPPVPTCEAPASGGGTMGLFILTNVSCSDAQKVVATVQSLKSKVCVAATGSRNDKAPTPFTVQGLPNQWECLFDTAQGSHMKAVPANGGQAQSFRTNIWTQPWS